MNKINIDPNKPLPASLGSEWEETFAKLILEYYFSDLFEDLSVDGERPDLRNEEMSVGVEVTNAENETSRELDSLYSRQYTYGNTNEKEKALKRINELGGKIGEYFLSHPVHSRDLSKIYKQVAEKTKKLNKNYKIFKKNYLFIFDTEYIIKDELPEVLKAIKESALGEKYSFDAVYLYCFGGDLYVFDLSRNKFLDIHDNDNMPQQLSINARSIIVKKYS